MLREVAGVWDVAVAGVADERFGERPVAFVVPERGGGARPGQALIGALEEQARGGWPHQAARPLPPAARTAAFAHRQVAAQCPVRTRRQVLITPAFPSGRVTRETAGHAESFSRPSPASLLLAAGCIADLPCARGATRTGCHRSRQRFRPGRRLAACSAPHPAARAPPRRCRRAPRPAMRARRRRLRPGAGAVLRRFHLRRHQPQHLVFRATETWPPSTTLRPAWTASSPPPTTR